jgi:serpin B
MYAQESAMHSRCSLWLPVVAGLVLVSMTAKPRAAGATDPHTPAAVAGLPLHNDTPSPEGTPPVTAIPQLVEGGNQFAWDLYRELARGEGNLFFSPNSISVALAMTYAGAAGTTQREMAATLHLGTDPDQLHQAMQSLLKQWAVERKDQGYQLRVANRLWGQRRYEFLGEFLAVTREYYGAELARLDFGQDAEAARGTINRWVEEQTENKIVDLIPSGALNSSTMLVLTNAVYFHGSWSRAFDKKLTRDDDFHLGGGKQVRVPLMHQRSRFRHGAVDGLQVLDLPYGNADLSLVVLLPDAVEGLGQLESQLTPERVGTWLAGARSGEVQVYLPKFKVTSSYVLNDALCALGMPSAFAADAADFSGMTGQRDLFISKVVHKAYVDVYEEGTEAAAATGVIMERTSVAPPRPVPIFRADHPFVFLIRDNRTGAILFLGRLSDPTA